jgi:hypothetical protein
MASPRSDASDERKEKAAAEAYIRIRSGQHWLDWMFVAEGLGVGRRHAQRISGTDDIQSPRYKRAFKEWMAPRPWAKDLDSPTRAHLFWCLDWRNDIDQWRETLAQNERLRLNHPTAMKRRYEATRTEKNAADPNTPKKETDREALIRRNAELEDKIKALETSARSRGDSLFDILETPANQIARCIVEETVRGGRFTKASQIKAALEKEIAARKKLGGMAQAG